MKKIIYKHGNNEVAIVHISKDVNSPLESLVTRVVPPGKEWRIVDESDIPTDRTFRDAWRWQETPLTSTETEDLSSTTNNEISSI